MSNTIKKTDLEKQIQSKAEREHDRLWRDLDDVVYKHPILRRLKFKVLNDESEEEDKMEVWSLRSLLERKYARSLSENYKEVKQDILDDLEKDYTDDLIRRVNDIAYLMNNQ